MRGIFVGVGLSREFSSVWRDNLVSPLSFSFFLSFFLSFFFFFFFFFCVCVCVCVGGGGGGGGVVAKNCYSSLLCISLHVGVSLCVRVLPMHM